MEENTNTKMEENQKMEMNLCNKISIKLALRNMRKSQCEQKNIVSSPISINLLLNMLAIGFEQASSGQIELMNALGFNTVDEINQASSKFMTLRNNNNTDTYAGPSSEQGGTGALKRKRYSELAMSTNTKNRPTLAIANVVFTHPEFPFTSEFVEIATHIYQSYTGTLDFTNRKRVVKEVNSWAEKQTDGIIKDLISEKTLEGKNDDDEAVLILANALYFKGCWATKFKKSMTEPEKFHLLDGTTVKVPFMKTTCFQYYRSFDDFKVLKLPYQSGGDQTKKFCMYFFLPELKNGLKGLLRKFKADPSPLHTNCESVVKCITWIPKFKILYDFEPLDIMKRMGIYLSEMGELMSMVDKPNWYWKGQVAKVIQKSYVKVMEEGTVAAAVTCAIYRGGYGCLGRRPKPPPPVRFIADHPFFFMIKDEVSGAVLFSGIVRNPSLS